MERRNDAHYCNSHKRNPVPQFPVFKFNHCPHMIPSGFSIVFLFFFLFFIADSKIGSPDESNYSFDLSKSYYISQFDTREITEAYAAARIYVTDSLGIEPDTKSKNIVIF